ncbi:MAG: hypothetical protein IKF22_03640 [Lachnospiraceae bacterium]|nr:hypothetical protein [Oscillospiraceae bacterium]MBR3170330.1 hypothetical protein [Lachnospiraceae bacterium]
MSEEFVLKAEYDERMRRIDDENSRQNHRIGKLEDVFEKINELTLSVREMATTMASMQQELQKQGKRLEDIEKEPADKWKTIKTTALTVLVTAVLTWALTRIGM